MEVLFFIMLISIAAGFLFYVEYRLRAIKTELYAQHNEEIHKMLNYHTQQIIELVDRSIDRVARGTLDSTAVRVKKQQSGKTPIRSLDDE